MKEEPLVSIIIPTLNSERTLEKCLSSINSQSYKNIETIIVDGGSKDKTVEIAKKMGVNIYYKKGFSISASTNLGVKISKGKYVYRIDSDVILDSIIVEESVQKCEKEGYDGVCIFWLPDDSISFWAKVRKIEKESYIEHPDYVGAIKYNKNVLGARFLRKDVFLFVGGENEKVPIAGEDYEFYNRLAKTNFKFTRVNAREKHIGEPRSLKDIYKKTFRYGCTLNRFFEENKQGRSQMSIFGRRYLIDAFKRALKKDIKLFFGLVLYGLVVLLSSNFGRIYCKLIKGDLK